MANESALGALWQTWLTWRQRRRERRVYGGFHPLDVACMACAMPKNVPCVGPKHELYNGVACLQRIYDARRAARR